MQILKHYWIEVLLILLLMGYCDTGVFAQKAGKRTSTSHYRGRFKNIKVPKKRSQIICPGNITSDYPHHAIGVKIGDPFALSYKLYASERLAFVLDGGKTASGLYSKYYRENFSEVVEKEQSLEIDYLGHEVKMDWTVQAKILFQSDASALLEGLQWYFGGGLQWRKVEIKYDYLLNIDFDNSEIGMAYDDYFTLGPAVTLGVEYAYAAAPISAFMELEWYTDIIKTPGFAKLMGGVGIRYMIH